MVRHSAFALLIFCFYCSKVEYLRTGGERGIVPHGPLPQARSPNGRPAPAIQPPLRAGTIISIGKQAVQLPPALLYDTPDKPRITGQARQSLQRTMALYVQELKAAPRNSVESIAPFFICTSYYICSFSATSFAERHRARANSGSADRTAMRTADCAALGQICSA